MTKRVEKLIAKSLAVLAYALPVGVAVWRRLGKKEGDARQKPATAAEPAPLSSTPSQELASLSLSTPGDAPLDRLARIAERERQAADESQRGARPADADSIDDLLRHQSLESCRLEGWSVPEPQRLPVPTFAPAVMAFGIVVFALGLATVWYICAMGALVFAIAAWRWAGELQESES